MVRWKNKRDLYAMSAIHDSGVTKIDRKHGDQVRKPNIMIGYNTYKERVDQCDQYLNYYSTGCKSL